MRKQGAPVGHTKVKGLNALLVVASMATSAPVITATRRAGVITQILVRADSGYFQPADIAAITKTGAWFSIG
ncbi:MAG: hypothetical protein WCF04_10485, partial [Candidatus Nanopelagicales bacterium]